MTIVVGLMARDGLVVAADRQETRGPIKVRQGKVSIALATDQTEDELRSRCFIISGAGSSNHIDAITKRMFDCVEQGESLSSEDLESRLRSLLKEFYQEHVFPDPTPPDFRLLIAAQLGRKNRLLVSDGTLLADAGSWAAIGAGEIVTTPLLSRLYKLPVPDIRSAIALASYVVFHAKESVEGCGYDTDISGFKKGEFFTVSRADMRQLDDAVRDYSRHVEPLMLRELTELGHPEAKKAARKARSKLSKLVRTLSLS